jgi:colicin import membrane protein
MGLVETPANPDSVIYPYSAAARFYTSCAAAGYQPVTGPTVEPLMEDLKKQLADAVAAKADADKAVAAEKARADAALEAKAGTDAALATAKAAGEDLKVKLAAEAEKVTAAKADLDAAKAKLAETETARAAAETDLGKVSLELKKVKRTQAAVLIGLPADEATKLVDNQLDLADDKFNAGLEVVKTQVTKAAKAVNALPEKETASADTKVLPDGKATAGTVTPPATGAGASTSKGLAKGIMAHTQMQKSKASRQENK